MTSAVAGRRRRRGEASPPLALVCACCGHWRVQGIVAEPWAPGQARPSQSRRRPVYRLEFHGFWYADLVTVEEVAAALGEHFPRLVSERDCPR